jgi:type I restriction enzyme S subunit
MATDKQYTTLNVPTLRFPEFSGEWGKYTLGEKGETIIGLTYSPKDVVQTDGIIVLRSSNIQNGLIDYKDIVRVQKKIKNSLITKKDDILVCARNGSARLIGKNALIEESDANHSFGAFMMIYRSPQNRFIHHLMNTKRYFSQVGENLGARINQVTTSDLNSFEFYFPTTANEINKIAAFIDLLNERIATQRKVIERLETLINGLNQAVLNNHGVKTQLKHVLTEVVEKTTKLNQYDVLSSTAKGLFLQSEYFDKEVASVDNVGYKILRKGQIVISPQNLWLGNINYNDCFEVGMVSPSYKIFAINDNNNSLYISLLMRTHKAFFEYANASEQGASIVRRNLNMDDFYAISFQIPSRQEQDYVASAYQCLFQRKQVEQKYLSQLEIQKTYLLSQMFI